MSATLRSRTLVLGMDAAWGGLGVCLSGHGEPLMTWHTVLPASLGVRRVARLMAFLRQVRVDVHTFLDEDTQVLVAVERIPDVYSGRGNQAATGYGLGRMAGCIEAWAAMTHEQDDRWLGSTWMVGTDDDEHGVGWRPWWTPGGHGNRRVGRAQWKAWAQRIVDQMGWEGWMKCAARAGAKATDDAREDVAEAILIACGASTRVHLSPQLEGGGQGGAGAECGKTRTPRGGEACPVSRAPGRVKTGFRRDGGRRGRL